MIWWIIAMFANGVISFSVGCWLTEARVLKCLKDRSRSIEGRLDKMDHILAATKACLLSSAELP